MCMLSHRGRAAEPAQMRAEAVLHGPLATIAVLIRMNMVSFDSEEHTEAGSLVSRCWRHRMGWTGSHAPAPHGMGRASRPLEDRL
jgi:hypothetical protein